MRFIILFLLCIKLSLSQNLVVNGDFSAGNTGFFTNYTYCNTGNCLFPFVDDAYSIGTNPNFFHSVFQGMDHTTGAGNMMIFNGGIASYSAWSQTITVLPSQTYSLSIWACSVYTNNIAKLNFSINGVSVGTLTPSSSVNIWTQFSATWTSNSNTTAVIRINTLNTVGSNAGVDFGLDDIEFKLLPPITPLCSGNLGLPVFLEDFGSGAALYGPALPVGVTNYPYYTGVPINGVYCISGTGNPANVIGYVDGPDHTGNSNGYMMVVNADYGPSEVYRKHVTGLCPNTTYVFSSYLANNNTQNPGVTNCGGSYIYANVKFQIEYPLGTVQNSVATGNLAVASTHTAFVWGQYGFVFTTLPSQTSVDIVLINNAPGGCGNDYVVDDITLSPCGPGVGLTLLPNKTTFCPGESMILQSNFTSGGYTNPEYQWQYSNDGGNTWTNIIGATSQNYSITSVTNSQSGTYRLLVAENGNVNLTSCRIIAGPLSFTVSNNFLTAASPTICPNAITTLTVTGAVTYTWSNGSNTSSITVNPSITTTYSVIGTIGTCSAQATLTVSVIPLTPITVTGNTIICNGGSTLLNANGANSYLWSTGINNSSISLTPSVTTTYSVIGTSNTCTNTAIVTVSVLPSPLLVVSPNTGICAGLLSPVTLTVSGSDSYTWANSNSLSSSTGASVVASPTTTTTYTVTGTTGLCTNTAIVTVSIIPSPVILSTIVDNTSCGLNNGSATVTATPASNTYSWTGVVSTTNVAGNLPPGNYTVTAINGICQTSTVLTISGSIPLLITSSSITPSNCNANNGSISVTDNLTGSNYHWSPGISSNSNTIFNLSPGNYSLTIVNGACTTSTTISVVTIGGPTAMSVISKNASCRNDSGRIDITNVINGVSPFLYNLNNSVFLSTSSFTNLSQGVYTISVKDANTCLLTQTISISQATVNLTTEIITNSPNCLDNDGAFIINKISGGKPPYLLSFNNTPYTQNTTFEALSVGIYTLAIKDSNACVNQLILNMPGNNGDYILYIPNTFTPNNDHKNDVWYVQGACLGEFHCYIYNRWGEKLHEIKDITEGWDGRYKGAAVPDGVYVYVLEVETATGIVNKAGHIVLLR
ncbi:MAG: gliding motility-associated C-terminal domain-containing protein [Bacteroidetes bacterium]|nr:gliding motility-associated C-terminal domain-containing protein [Bacteroidota bacterium]